MPTLTIDGHTVTVPEGATILDAARALAIDVPTLCWYPKLPVVGNCRICLVHVEGAPDFAIEMRSAPILYPSVPLLPAMALAGPLSGGR